MSDAEPVPAGAVLWFELPVRRPPGHEQVGRRPCVVLADPGRVQGTRFPVLIVAPLTSARHLPPGPLYVHLKGGSAGLPVDSTMMLDQVAAMDARRVRGYLGQLGPTEYAPVEEGLRAMFGL